jgi:hypothetical protein
MPHGWVASDFINAALDMVAYERAGDNSLVLAAGVPLSWIEGRGISVKRLRTPYGALAYSLRRGRGGVELTYSLDGKLPSGGLVLKAPGTSREYQLQGRRGRIDLPLEALPEGVSAAKPGPTSAKPGPTSAQSKQARRTQL